MQTPASHAWNFRLTFKLVHTFGSANEAGPGVNAERAANLFAPAARRVAQICGAATAVGFGDKETRSTFAVSSLSFLGLGKADGIPFRACFLQPVSMHKLLTQAALDSQLNNTSHKRRCIPASVLCPDLFGRHFQGDVCGGSRRFLKCQLLGACGSALRTEHMHMRFSGVMKKNWN